MNKKPIFIFIVLVLITIPSIVPFLNSKFFYTQDHIFIARFHQISAALSDGHFPVRWVPDLRFGEPLFNFYAPFPYYLGGLIHLTGLDFIWVAKMLFILSSILSAVTMYILCNKLFNSRAALLGSILYVYAPYRAVDIYVRGALSETWAFVFFPLIFYCSILLSEKTNLLRICLLALSLAGLFLTHNVTTLMFAPFLFLFWAYLILKSKNVKIIPFFLVSSILGIGLAAFFLFPAFIERDMIQTKYLLVGYFDFRAHFIAFYQLFSPFWGYGSSLWGPVDDMSFQIGLVNWLILIIGGISGFIYRKNKQFLILLFLLNFSFLMSIFMQHNKSAFVWEAIPILAFIQFPWRFLAISVFFVSIVGALIGEKLQSQFKYLYIVLISLAVIVNISYFKPKEYVNNDFFEKFLNKGKMNRGIDLTKDYLPIWVEGETEYFGTPRAIEGEIAVSRFEKKTAFASGSINALSDSLAEIPITYFPGWVALVDGEESVIEPSNKNGLISLKIPKGKHEVIFKFEDTPVRANANLVSALSLAIVFGIFMKSGLKKLKVN